MQMLVKGTLVTASIFAALWIGHRLPVATGQAERTKAIVKQQPPGSEMLHKTLDRLNTRLASLEEGQRSLSTLSRRLEQLEATQQGLWQSLAEAENDQSEALHPESGPEDPLGVSQEAVKKAQDLIVYYEGVFWNERRDATWSAETETRILQAWEREAPQGSHLLTTTCQSSLCRVEVGHDHEGAREQFMAHLAQIMPFETEGIFYPLMEGEEQVGTVVYLARPGYPLPSGLTP